VDEDYRGNVGVVLFNHSDKAFDVTRGDRIAQLICQQICYPALEEVKVGIITILCIADTECVEIPTAKLDSPHL